MGNNYKSNQSKNKGKIFFSCQSVLFHQINRLSMPRCQKIGFYLFLDTWKVLQDLTFGSFSSVPNTMYITSFQYTHLIICVRF